MTTPELPVDPPPDGTAPEEVRRRLARRYGAAAPAHGATADDPAVRTRGRRTALLGAGTLVLALTLWALGVALTREDPGVAWQDRAIQVRDDDHTSFTFLVTAEPGTRVVCTVRILNRGRTDVGRVDVTAGPSTRRTFPVTADVPTAQRGAAGTVRACAVAAAR